MLAATVWAWVPERGPGRVPNDEKSSFTTDSFTRLGIRGLSSRPSVTRYRRAWQEAMDAGVACTVELHLDVE